MIATDFNIIQEHNFELCISSNANLNTFNKDNEQTEALKNAVVSVNYNMFSKTLNFKLLTNDRTLHFIDNIDDVIRVQYTIFDEDNKYTLYDGVAKIFDVSFTSSLNLQENTAFNPLLITVKCNLN